MGFPNRASELVLVTVFVNVEILLRRWRMIEDVEVVAKTRDAVQTPTLRNWAALARLVEIHDRVTPLQWARC